MAEQGVASRRKSEELITAGKVKVNGQVVTVLGTKIDPSKDKVGIGKNAIEPASEKYYFLLYKPTNTVTTTQDENDRPTVLSLLPKELQKKHLYPVGRLDMDTSGLLLLTNDGELTYQLTHPKHGVHKVYEARVEGVPTPREMWRFRDGLQVAHRRTAPAQIEIINQQKDQSLLRITLHEGRNHQVKRMCLAINHPVLSLKRVEFAGLNLGTLAAGEGRELNTKEVEQLKKLATNSV
jgi:23S rRNA pseudouridine2605 synthase